MSALTDRPAFAGLRNDAAGGNVAATTAAAGYPASNLLIPNYSDVWRSAAITATNIDLDFGASKTGITLAALLGVNLTPTATVRWVFYGGSFVAVVHDSGTITAYNNDHAPADGLDDTPSTGLPLVYLPPSALTARSLRITITDSANTDGYMQAAHAIAGPVLQPGPAAEWATGVNWFGPLGAAVVRRSHTFTFRHVDTEARRRVLSVSRTLQGAGRFLVLPQPGRPATWIAETVLARLRIPAQEDPLPGRIWDITMQAEEVTD